jgi:hypothetical protein
MVSFEALYNSEYELHYNIFGNNSVNLEAQNKILSKKQAEFYKIY